MVVSHPEVELRRLLWIGPVTIVAAVVAVLTVRVVAFAVLDLSSEFVPLSWSAIIFWTVVLVAGGVLVFAVVARLAADPVRMYRRLALGTLLASFLPDLFLPGSGPGATWTAAIVLMLMHVVAWWTTVTILTRQMIRNQANG